MLLNKITDFQEILPLIENLRKPSIKPRHWQEVMSITKTTFPYESETFSLAHIMDSPILKFKDDVEEVSCEGMIEGVATIVTRAMLRVGGFATIGI